MIHCPNTQRNEYGLQVDDYNYNRDVVLSIHCNFWVVVYPNALLIYAQCDLCDSSFDAYEKLWPFILWMLEYILLNPVVTFKRALTKDAKRISKRANEAELVRSSDAGVNTFQILDIITTVSVYLLLI